MGCNGTNFFEYILVFLQVHFFQNIDKIDIFFFWKYKTWFWGMTLITLEVAQQPKNTTQQVIF